MSYGILNLFFLGPALLALLLCYKIINWKVLGLTLLVLTLLTAIFDNFIVGSGIVGYDKELISNIFIGFAPIEDFGYTVFATIVIPISWWLLGKRSRV